MISLIRQLAGTKPVVVFFAASVVATAAVRPALAQDLAPLELFNRMSDLLAEAEQDLIAIRHDLHQHPEVSGAEERTSSVIATRLGELGFEVRTGVGGYGVVGVLRGTASGPTVAFRADMDAVPSSSPDPVPYRSVVPGVRHICGHDVHTTIGLAIAESFASIREELAGTVMLVFQPAEERGTGAKAMLADGVFAELTPDAIFALHTAPYNVGQVATAVGGMMAGRAFVRVTIRGDGDLAAAATTVRQTIESKGSVSPRSAGQVAPKGFVLTQLFPGTARATSGDGRVVRGQVMTAGPVDRARAKNDIVAALEVLEIPGVAIETEYDEHFMEGVTNDTSLVDLANAAIRNNAPEIDIQEVPGAVPMFSEDFGSFQALTPGVMYFLGVSNPETGTVGMPHSPNYVADDAAILVGTRAILAAMLARLAGN